MLFFCKMHIDKESQITFLYYYIILHIFTYTYKNTGEGALAWRPHYSSGIMFFSGYRNQLFDRTGK